MPELPEVQTVVNELNLCTLNKKILDIKINAVKLLKNCTPEQFKKFLIGEKITHISRMGKYLIFELTHHKKMVSHLRMEGKYFFENKKDDYDKKHVLLQFVFAKQELRYHDTRRFGTFNIYLNDDHLKSKELSKLALDPIDPNFNGKYLYEKIHKIHRAIKTTILDQTNVAGIGNIYADEILFACHLNPLTPANQITIKQADLIAKKARDILLWAIECNGTTIASYKFKKGHIGSFQEKLQVHTKVKWPCPTCKTIILKVKVNGRGTYYCPKCQKGK
ncbi:DNA-formamidopyrimidine glycosylase [[Mycoplasma] testudinis]|uniref:DNA-formamidopyrimidine glycosylase n=1 Tax=[Mycoplasma] testudinis TaxID=33924 RepID=UPI00047FDFE4|nr:DNA-formamidopyrimidine glycosylase [[Mycoplasma] testudinis]